MEVYGLHSRRLSRPRPVHAADHVFPARRFCGRRTRRSSRSRTRTIRGRDPRSPGATMKRWAVVCEDHGEQLPALPLSLGLHGSGIWIDPNQPDEPAEGAHSPLPYPQQHSRSGGLHGRGRPAKGQARNLAQGDDHPSGAGVEPPALRASHRPVRRRLYGPAPERHGACVRSRPHLASTYGVRMGNADRTIFSHCEFNGGMPPGTSAATAKTSIFSTTASRSHNNLGKQTVAALTSRQPPPPTPRSTIANSITPTTCTSAGQHRLPSQLDQQPER